MKSIDLVLLGEFVTTGKILITDPGYEKESDSVLKVKIKEGVYDSFLVRGQLKNPIFAWDKVPGNYRNAELVIVNQECKEPIVFKATKEYVCVDSGQAGFFNVDIFGKELEVEIDLPNEDLSFFREQISSNLLTIERNQKLLAEKSCDLWNRMNKHFGDDKKTEEWFTREIENAKISLEEDRKIVETKTLPQWFVNHKKVHGESKSKDFYEIVCDVTKSEDFGGMYLETEGTVCASGEGDGYYNVHEAKNKKGEIVALRISFIPLACFK